MVEWILTRHPLRPSDGPRGFDVPLELIVDSPYAMPDAMRGSRDHKSGKFVIEFRYMDGNESPVRGKDLEPGIAIEVGKHSQRILRITISPEKANSVDNVELVLGVLQKSLASDDTTDKRNKQNRQALGQAVKRRENRLRDQLLAST